MSARHFNAAAEWSAGMLTRLSTLLNTTASRTVHVPEVNQCTEWTQLQILQPIGKGVFNQITPSW